MRYGHMIYSGLHSPSSIESPCQRGCRCKALLPASRSYVVRSVVSTCLRTPAPRPRVLGGPGGSTSSEDGYHNHSTSTYPGPCGSCMVTPCGMRTRNLRIRGPTPCPLGQGGCDARNRSWNHKRSIHVYPIREAGTTRHTYRKCT